MVGKNSVFFALVALVVLPSAVRSDDVKLAPDAIRAAVRRAIPLLEKGSADSAEQRQCFTCHNQALPVFALAEARKRGFAVDNENLQRQLRHTEAHLERGRERYLKGRGQGGQVITAGYALWTLQAGGLPGNQTTSAVTHYLLEYQKDLDRWSHPGRRPPTAGSDFTTTYVALRALAAFGTDEQRDRIDQRTKTVRQWLLAAEPRDNEDRVFRLRALAYVDADDETQNKASADLLQRQRDDGGWAQTDEMQSDTYATATALVALLNEGGLSADHPTVRRGVHYLLDTQLEDGSWHVLTRADPFQTYYESGYPHGKDQFISISAAAWATLALLLTLPEPVATEPLTVDLWPGKVPGDVGVDGEENSRIYESPILDGPTKLITNVTKPTLTIHRPSDERNTGTAMIICPGGGYHDLFWELEGEEVAAWLNEHGMTGIILKYRVPRRPGDDRRAPPLGPLLDAQRAVSLVRSRASEWGINPQRIGMVGFSAGGHLALATATSFEKRTYEPVDAFDQASCRPDFAVLCYSGFLKANDKDAVWPGIHIPSDTPPILLAHSSDDEISDAENSVIMYLALKRAGIPAELHVYATGDHDFGVRQNAKLPSSWTRLCLRWLSSQQFLVPRTRNQ